MPRQPKKPQAEWEAQKERIYAYYISENKTLEQTMDLMRHNHDFHATKKEYLGRLGSWRMSKNLKKADWELIHSRNLAHKQTKVLFENRSVDPKRVKRAPGRYKFGSNSFEEGRRTSTENRGLIIRSPSPIQPMFGFGVSTTTVPWFQLQHTFRADLLSMIQRFIPILTRTNSSDSASILLSPGQPSLGTAKSLLRRFVNMEDIDNDENMNTGILHRLQELLPQKSKDHSSLISNEPFFLLVQLFVYLSSNGKLNLKDLDNLINWVIENGGKPLFYQIIICLEGIRNPAIEIFMNNLLLSAISLEEEELISALLKGHVEPHGNSCQQPTERWDIDYSLPSFPIDNQLNPLQFAVITGNLNICRTLLEYGANPNHISRHMPFTPFELAVSYIGGNFAIAEMLVNLHADINLSCDLEIINYTKDNELDSVQLIARCCRKTLLMKAVETQNLETVRLLIFHGADLNAVSEIAGTAIQIAVRNDDLDMVELLLNEGADVNLPSIVELPKKYGKYYLETFQKNSEGYLNRGFDHVEKIILSRAQSYFQNLTRWSDFFSPIQIAVKKNNITMVQNLLKAGADINLVPDWDGIQDQIVLCDSTSAVYKMYQHMLSVFKSMITSALHLSVANGNIEMTMFLLQNGAIIDQMDGSGSTPLQVACGLEDSELEDAHQVSGPGPSQIRVFLAQILLLGHSDVNWPPGPGKGQTILQSAIERGEEDLVELLLDWGADLNTPSGSSVQKALAKAVSPGLMMNLAKRGIEFTEDDYWLALYFAALKGDVLAAEFLSAQDVDINGVYSTAYVPEITGTILQAGIKSGDIEVVRMLLNAGAELDALFEGETALCTATRENRLDVLQMLIASGASLSVPEMDTTPLAIAAASGFIDIAERILEAGADPNQISEDPAIPQVNSHIESATPLAWTIERFNIYDEKKEEFSEEFIQEIESMILLLVSSGADPNLIPESRPGALALACRHLSDSIVQTLIDCGADINKLDQNHETPIMIATRSSRKETVQILLDEGAELGGAMEAALYYEPNSPALSEDVARILIGAGAHLRVDRMLLVLVIIAKFYDLAVELVENGINVNLEPVDGDIPDPTPLWAATWRDNIGLVQLLLDSGANPNDSDPKHTLVGTALQIAVENGNFNMAKLLIEKGADIGAAAPTGRQTALQLAAKNGRLDIAHLLLENDKKRDTIELRCKEAAILAGDNGHPILARILRNYKS